MGQRERDAIIEMYGNGKAGKEMLAAYDKAHPEIAGTTGGPLVKGYDTTTVGRGTTAEDKHNKPGAPPPKYSANDMTQPGTGEAAFGEHGGKLFEEGEASKLYKETKGTYTTPGKSEEISGKVADDLYRGSQGDTYGDDYVEGLAGRGGLEDPGYVEAAWQNMQGTSADLNPYYDLAFQDSQRQINQAAAARGQFDSSGTMRRLTETSTRLNAQQAMDEAKYGLDRATAMGNLAVAGTGARANWNTSMGELAFKADDQRRLFGESASLVADRASKAELDRLKTGIDAAMGADTTEANRLAIGLEEAFRAQEAREGRVTGQQDYNLKIAEMIERIYSGANTADANSAGTATSTGMAASEDERRTKEAAANARIQALLDSLNSGMGAIPGYGSGGSGGSGGSTSTGK